MKSRHASGPAATLEAEARETAQPPPHSRTLAPIRQLADSNIIGIMFGTRDGQIVDANDEFLRMVGHSRRDLEAGELRWTDMTPAEWGPVTRLAGKQLDEMGRAAPFEKEFFRKDGTRVPVLMGIAETSQPGLDGLCFVVDLTERKQTEKDLDRLMIERFAMLDSVGDGIYGQDKDGRCTFVNAAAVRMLGYQPDECLGGNMHELVHFKYPDGRPFPAENCPVVTALKACVAARVENDVVWRKDGTSLPVHYSCCPIVVNGRIEGSVVTFQDISERKTAEEKLRSSEQRYRRIVENFREGICLCDSGQAVTYCNPRMKEMLGYADAIPSLHCSDLFFEEDRPDLLRRYGLLKDGTVEPCETRIRRADGSALWVNCTLSQIPDEQGNFAGSLAMFTAIIAPKRLEEQLHHAQKTEAVGQLAGGLAHDFNNLLTVMLGYSGLLEERLDPHDPLLRNVVEIRKAGERAAALTQKLLAFSCRQVLAPRVISLNRLIRDLVPTLRRLVGEDVGLVTELDPAAGNIQADPGQIEQIILNLSINARDAMPEGGRLLIQTTRCDLDAAAAASCSLPEGPYIQLMLTDNGRGMEEYIRAGIFEPFFTTKDSGAGAGLGLASVLGIVKQSGGAISVSSEINRGASFKIYLPLAKQACDALPPHVPAPAAAHGEVILLVEDCDSIRAFTREILEQRGYRVLEASGAEDALTVDALSPVVDLLLTDVVLPGMDGHELAKQLSIVRPDLKVLFMSGSGSGSDLNFLRKPFQPQDLVRRITQVLTDQPSSDSLLIVDDDDQVRSFLATLFEAKGYTVFQASNGKQAYALCRENLPDLVITDLVMPEQEGLETIHAICQEWPHLPVIAISGAFGGAFLELARKLGADAVLKKPIAPNVILNEVRRLTAR